MQSEQQSHVVRFGRVLHESEVQQEYLSQIYQKKKTSNTTRGNEEASYKMRPSTSESETQAVIGEQELAAVLQNEMSPTSCNSWKTKVKRLSKRWQSKAREKHEPSVLVHTPGIDCSQPDRRS